MKKIAITQRLLKNETYHEVRDALDIRWADLFSKLYILPVILPNTYDPAIYFNEMKIDGVILSGGNDLYGVSGNTLSNIRDRTEEKIIAICVERNIPLMGVCRGMQLLAVHFGGHIKEAKGHVAAHHRIKVNESSKFSDELKKLNQVNSFHNFCVDKIPEDFKPSAWSEDGYCEAMEHIERDIFAEMWHPERQSDLRDADLQIISNALRL